MTSRNMTALRIASVRRTPFIAALALAVLAMAGLATPSVAGFRSHGGGFQSHVGFGGFHHFDHRFDHRFAFAGFGFAPGYDYGDAYPYDGCWRRVWGPYGWRWVSVCY